MRGLHLGAQDWDRLLVVAVQQRENTTTLSKLTYNKQATLSNSRFPDIMHSVTWKILFV